MGVGALVGALVGMGAAGAVYAGGTGIFIAGMGSWWLAGASIGSLFDAPKLDTSQKSTFNQIDNSDVPYLPVPLIYGEYRVGGNIFYKKYLDTDRTEMDLFLSLSEGPIAGISSIMASDQDTEDLTTSTFVSHLGTFPQAVDSLSEADKQLGYPGTAYISAHLEASTKLKGTPIISAIVQGRTVWTPPGASSSLGGDLTAKFYKINQYWSRVDGSWSRTIGDLFFEVEVSDIDFAEYDLDENRYYAEYTGYIQPSETGNYSFRLDSSTGADALYIDGELIADGADVALEADEVYSIRVCFWCGSTIISGTTWELSGGEDPQWSWTVDYFPSGTEQRAYYTTPTLSEAIIPSSVLYGGISAYSTNPVWCLLDYLRNKRYGLGLSDDFFDIDFENPDGTSSWEIAADYCDETMDDGDPRYSMGICFNSQENFIDQIQKMLSSFRGYLICRDQVIVKVEKYETSYVKELDGDHIVEGSFGFYLTPQNEIPNKIEITWTDPESDMDSGGHWGSVSAVAQNEQRIINEGVRAETVDLTMITNQRQAQDMAYYLLEQAENAPLHMSFSVGLQDSDIEIGEIVKITHPLLDESKWARVMKTEDGQDDMINLLCRQYYIPDYDSDQSYEADRLVKYDDHIYKSKVYIPNMTNKTILSGAVASSEYSTYLKENAFDDPDLGETVWMSGETGTGVNGVAYIGQIFSQLTRVQDILLNQSSVEILDAENVTSVKVQEYDPETDAWSDVETISGISGDQTLVLSSASNFYGLRLLANCDLSTDKMWGVSKLGMYDKNVDTTPVISEVINSTYWELVE